MTDRDELPHDAGVYNTPMPKGGLRFVCPACQGKKPEPTPAPHNTGPDSSGHYWSMVTLTCGVCDSDPLGATREDVERWAHGNKMRAEREARGEILYYAAKRMGISSAALSAIEWGKRPPAPSERTKGAPQ